LKNPKLSGGEHNASGGYSRCCIVRVSALSLYVLPTVRSFVSGCVHVFYFCRVNDDFTGGHYRKWGSLTLDPLASFVAPLYFHSRSKAKFQIA